jgi:phospholipase A1
MRLGDHNKGSIKIDYSFRILDNLRFHTQFFSGYGESLIDFNHRQSVIGFGVSVVEWR